MKNPLFKETTEKYYWLGFLFADGCVSGKYNVVLALSYKDFDHLLKFRNFIKLTNRGKNIKITETDVSYRMCTCGKDLVQYLQNKYNLLPRKSFNACPKNIPKKYMKYFLLGYFDGDGSIFTTKRGDMIVSIVGSKQMLKIILNWDSKFKNNNITKHKSIYELRWGELDSYCFLARLYDKKIIPICLNRKYQRFLKLKEKVENRFKNLIDLYR